MKKEIYKQFIGFSLLICFTLIKFINVSHANQHEEFIKAYDSGNYVQALEVINTYPAEMKNSANYFYNLGNTYFKLSKIGEAIYYYKRALELNPRDPDLKYNFSLASKKTVDKIEKSLSINSILSFKSFMNLFEEFVLFAVVSFVFWVLLILKVKIKSTWNETITTTAYLLLPIYLIIAVIVTKDCFDTDNFGVIIANESDVMSSTGDSGTLLFKVHAGSEFSVQDIDKQQHEKWIKIELADGKRGWIQAFNAITNDSITQGNN